MSHFTTIQTQIRDLDALRVACAEMNLKLLANSKCRGYAGTTRLAPHVIQLKGPYDIAVEPSKENDGSYGLTTDWWDGHVAKEVGTGYGRLLQSYGVHKTMSEARSRGLRSTRRIEADTQARLLAAAQPPKQPTTARRRRLITMSQTLRFNPGGHIDCLYTEAIDLRALGRLQVVRATDIRFCEKTQLWNVRCASSGQLLHSHPSRETCLVWERENLGPPNPEKPRSANTLPNLKPVTGRL